MLNLDAYFEPSSCKTIVDFNYETENYVNSCSFILDDYKNPEMTRKIHLQEVQCLIEFLNEYKLFKLKKEFKEEETWYILSLRKVRDFLRNILELVGLKQQKKTE